MTFAHGLLWLCLPLSLLFAWKALGRVTNWSSAYHRLALSVPLALTSLVVFTELSAAWTHALGYSLILTSFALVIGTASLWRTPRQRLGWSIPRSGMLVLVLLWGAVTTVLVSFVVLKFDFHDQISTQGHPAVVEAILRGNFPPHMQIFPEVPLKYHFGADLLSAIFSYLTGWPGYLAINITQILGWIAAIACLYVFCREAGMGRGWAFLAMNWMLLGAGWVYLLKPWLDLPTSPEGGSYHWPTNYVVFKHYLNPGTISYFFQTPFSLGLSVFFAYLTLLQSWIQERRFAILMLGALLLGSLSLIQIMLFANSLGATLVILFAQPCFEKKSFLKSWGEGALLLFTAVLLGFFLGGLLGHSGQYAKGLFVFHWLPNYLRYATEAGNMELTPGQSFLWYLSTFGSLALLGLPAMLWAAISLRNRYHPLTLFFLSFSVASFLLPQFFHYLASWDIIKWFTGFQLATSFLILWMAFRSGKPSRWLVALLIPLILLDIIPGFRFLYGFAFNRPEDFKGSDRSWLTAVISPPTPGVAYLIQLIRAGAWNDLVLAPFEFSKTLAHYSGQSMAMIDHNTLTFGPKLELVAERNTIIQNLAKNFSMPLLSQSRIRWLIFPCAEFERFMSPASQEAILSAVNAGELKQIPVPPELGCWKVYRMP